MILNIKPLSLAEVKTLAGDLEEKKEMRDYLKKFGKVAEDKAKKLAGEISGLGNIKMKEEHIVKIVDFLPKNSSDLVKIFAGDVTLDEKETNDILEITARY